MKVLIINSVCGVGSTGRICTDLYDEMVRNGNECCIAFGRGNANNKYNNYKIGGKCEVLGHYVMSRVFGRNGLHSSTATKELISFIISYAPDVIHLHNIHGYFINYELLFEFLKSQFSGKIIWTLHDCWTFSGGSAFIDFELDMNLNTYYTGFFGRGGYPKSFVNRSQKNFLQKMNAFSGLKNLTIVTPSLWLKRLVESTYLSMYTVECIYNGIDLEKFSVISKAEKRNTPPKILAVANIWDERKGLLDIVETAKMCPQYEFTIVGKVRKRYNLSNLVFVNQTKSIEDLARLYNQSDIFINPTYQDNFPTTNIESMACGTPIVTYKTGGSPECINGESGIVCSGKSPYFLSEGIRLLLQNKSITSSKCRERARKFSKSNFFRAYYKLYEEGSDENSSYSSIF